MNFIELNLLLTKYSVESRYIRCINESNFQFGSWNIKWDPKRSDSGFLRFIPHSSEEETRIFDIKQLELLELIDLCGTPFLRVIGKSYLIDSIRLRFYFDGEVETVHITPSRFSMTSIFNRNNSL